MGCVGVDRIKLVYDSRKRKEDNPHEAHMMKSYGLGFLFGSIATFAWQIYDYYVEANPNEEWKGIFELDIGSPVFGDNILSFATFFCLGFSIVFISNTVERDVQRRKPILTNILIFAECLFLVAMFYPVIALYIIYAWIVVLSITGVNIVITYIKLIWSTTGEVKKKALFVFLGVFLTFASLAMRNFILPNMIPNAIGVFFIYVTYFAVKMK